MHDLVIRGGTVIDGTGSEGRNADVAVRDGRIAEVGPVAERGARELDADGLLVTPGWVDVHTHYDGQATWDPYLSPSCWHSSVFSISAAFGCSASVATSLSPSPPETSDTTVRISPPTLTVSPSAT